MIVRSLLAAVVLLAASLTTHAAGVVDSRTGVVFCSAYSGASFGPDGNVRVDGCVSNSIGTPPVLPSSAGTLAVSSVLSSPNLQPGWSNSVAVTRVGGSAGAVRLALGVSGGCQLGSPYLDWSNGDSGTPSVGVFAPPGVQSCTVSLVSATSGADINPAAQSLTLASAAIAKCALPLAASTQPVTFGFGVNTLIQMAPGTVAYGALPSVRTVNSFSTVGQVDFDMTSTSPASGTVEISVNHCPGAIDTAGGGCYSNYFVPNAVNWSEVATTATNACHAEPKDGPWYVNVRFNYTGCGYGQSCGYVGQLQAK